MGVTTLAKAGNSDLEVVQYASLSDRPSAASFGVGVCQVGGDLYSCDGDSYELIKRSENITPVRLSKGILSTYAANVVTNSGAVTSAELDALKLPLERLILKGVYQKLIELWVPLGNGINAAAVKLKTASGVAAAMTVTAFVDGDYTAALGLTGDGATKKLATGFTPGATYKGNWGFGVYVTQKNSAGNHVFCGDGSNAYVGFSVTDAKIDGSVGVTAVAGKRLHSVQVGSGTAAAKNGIYQTGTQAAGASNTGALYLFAHNSSLFASGSLGGYAAWSPALTDDELAELNLFFDSVSENIYRTGWANSVCFVGDSNTSGFGLASPTTTRFAKLLADKLGLTEDNQGSPDWMMSDTTGLTSRSPETPDGSFAISKKISSTVNSAAFIVVALGVNDERYEQTSTAFERDYRLWVSYQLSLGYKPEQIILLSLPHSTDTWSTASRQVIFNGIIETIAKDNGFRYVDIYTPTAAGGSFQGDNIHLSVAGHATVATAIFNALCVS